MRHLAAAVVLGLSAVATTAALAGGAEQTRPTQIERIPSTTTSLYTSPRPIGTEDDVYCSGWIGETDEVFPGAIMSAEAVDSQRSFFFGDVVYLDIGEAQGVAPGQEFWIVRPGRLIDAAGSYKDTYGRLYWTPGRVRVICVQDRSAIAEVTLSCSDVVVGDKLLPFEPIPIPLVRRTPPLNSCDPSSGKLLGHIIASRDDVTTIGNDTVVFIDLGDTNGLVAGDFLSVYRTRFDVTGLRTVVGELAILMTKNRSAVAKVVWMKDYMQVGDAVELK